MAHARLVMLSARSTSAVSAPRTGATTCSQTARAAGAQSFRMGALSSWEKSKRLTLQAMLPRAERAKAWTWRASSDWASGLARRAILGRAFVVSSLRVASSSEPEPAGVSSSSSMPVTMSMSSMMSAMSSSSSSSSMSSS
ncbi:hypothetical protein B0T11DRAFT_289023 [Plectosphaerella cucumerina]|uniref:Uncharacterized protein n=1 Tax=Plectosphaerella cucumerina TaxID=40658 RepID=A0A8K0T5P7_9PEZI|nr:hypothetical protein B0T11DRAFT_289023 [Plectosphaerella cucumerina]